MKIYIVGCEPVEPNCVGSFDWFMFKETADRYFEKETTQNDSFEHKNIIYMVELEIVSDKNLTRSEITEFLDNYLADKGWNNAPAKDTVNYEDYSVN